MSLRDRRLDSGWSARNPAAGFRDFPRTLRSSAFAVGRVPSLVVTGTFRRGAFNVSEVSF